MFTSKVSLYTDNKGKCLVVFNSQVFENFKKQIVIYNKINSYSVRTICWFSEFA